MKIGWEIRKIWHFEISHCFGKHFLTSPYEYSNERVDDVIPSQFFIYGSEFWMMYNWPFSDLEHFYYTWFAPSYSETISFGVVVKSTIRAFRKHILYIPLLVFVHHTGLQMQKNDKKWCFYSFSFFRNHPVNFQATLLILSNYSVNLVCLGPVS